MVDIIWECRPCGWAQAFEPDDLPPLCPCCYRPLLKLMIRDPDGVDILVE